MNIIFPLLPQQHHLTIGSSSAHQVGTKGLSANTLVRVFLSHPGRERNLQSGCRYGHVMLTLGKYGQCSLLWLLPSAGAVVHSGLVLLTALPVRPCVC